MKRYLLTGAPGAGKSTLIRRLATLGHAVVEEAATDQILSAQAAGDPEPWSRPGFIDAVAALQRARRLAPPPPGAARQFHDRSALCTEALRRFLGAPASAALAEELEAIGGDFERRVFLVDMLGFIEPTPVRRISFEDARAFEAVHEAVYREHGYSLVRIAAGPVEVRLAQILAAAA
jgi:predicted ATPase